MFETIQFFAETVVQPTVLMFASMHARGISTVLVPLKPEDCQLPKIESTPHINPFEGCSAFSRIVLISWNKISDRGLGLGQFFPDNIESDHF